jgi:hypothetical protein
MSVENGRTVDAVGVDKMSGQVILTIADELDWEEEQIHLVLLQDKINTYLSFIESGELIEANPDARDRKAVISVVGKYKPTADAIRFFLQIQDVVEPIGIGFRFDEFETLRARQ